MEHQIFSFGMMILRDRCSTSYDLASLFRGRRSSLDRWSQLCTQLSTFERKSHRISSFLNVFDVVNFEK